MRSSLLLLALVACRHPAEEAGEDKPAPATVTCTPVASAEVADVVEVNGVIAPPPKLDAIVS